MSNGRKILVKCINADGIEYGLQYMMALFMQTKMLFISTNVRSI